MPPGTQFRGSEHTVMTWPFHVLSPPLGPPYYTQLLDEEVDSGICKAQRLLSDIVGISVW